MMQADLCSPNTRPSSPSPALSAAACTPDRTANTVTEETCSCCQSQDRLVMQMGDKKMRRDETVWADMGNAQWASCDALDERCALVTDSWDDVALPFSEQSPVLENELIADHAKSGSSSAASEGYDSAGTTSQAFLPTGLCDGSLSVSFVLRTPGDGMEVEGDHGQRLCGIEPGEVFSINSISVEFLSGEGKWGMAGDIQGEQMNAMMCWAAKEMHEIGAIEAQMKLTREEVVSSGCGTVHKDGHEASAEDVAEACADTANAPQVCADMVNVHWVPCDALEEADAAQTLLLTDSWDDSALPYSECSLVSQGDPAAHVIMSGAPSTISGGCNSDSIEPRTQDTSRAHGVFLHRTAKDSDLQDLAGLNSVKLDA
ncbi:uncharacterized protein LAESUDRAFT_710009 [Laetiporus sulphureus 93-53]|uniref:Uncharacterized protein n=1 Tax=Laetiporus sulphureus 93-53 TaxID=1314785 RepID=A0A165IBK4_9APHY|nr:uncharacterized protein LAESUDRAFT_710009 [Laetiporus sulphureus 93-53]KZT12852.1 hypothetical protein LAESUDRAFT_710009 [Laetiporus sulphureus 93-53]